MIRVTVTQNHYNVLFELLDMALKANGISSIDLIYDMRKELLASAEHVKEETPVVEETSNG